MSHIPVGEVCPSCGQHIDYLVGVGKRGPDGESHYTCRNCGYCRADVEWAAYHRPMDTFVKTFSAWFFGFVWLLIFLVIVFIIVLAAKTAYYLWLAYFA